MAHICREGDIIRIFAQTVSGQDLMLDYVNLAGKRLLRGGPSRFKIYDYGRGRTYVPSYHIGSTERKPQLYAEPPSEISRAFKEAGLPAPSVRRTYTGHLVYPLLHALRALKERIAPRRTKTVAIPKQS